MSEETYHAYTRDGAQDQPLVFSFHGTGGNENQFVPLVERILPHAAIVSPRGDVSERHVHRVVGVFHLYPIEIGAGQAEPRHDGRADAILLSQV